MTRRRTLLLAASALALAPLTVAAGPACEDPVADVLHEAHETLGPLGEPVHIVEDAYCDVRG